ncbi:hypothetical protein HUT16_17865 [Kitasatospora sp. NA04385]|uniref:hypothetical protein n=1 Tax=Kitasatospora sp. NA04385 TaxID=2742135 RepID=UPI00158FFB99|nr:hypothetical protein [Kitasatospora sp. NA04385]QKW20688.1 hypothetical protein HUT16_17865 [Kitasatospora sp. NA04385]
MLRRPPAAEPEPRPALVRGADRQRSLHLWPSGCAGWSKWFEGLRPWLRALLFVPPEADPCPALLEADGRWHLAEYVGDGFLARRSAGTTLAEALRALPR